MIDNKNEDIQSFELGAPSHDGSVSPLHRWRALPSAVRVSIIKTVTRLTIIAVAAVLYFAGNADTDENFMCEVAMQHVLHNNCTINDDESVSVKPSHRCEKDDCIARTCGYQLTRNAGTNLYVGSDDNYYQYDKPTAVTLRKVIFCLFIFYSISTEFLNRIVEDVDKETRVEIQPSQAVLVTVIPVLASVIACVTAKQYMDGDELSCAYAVISLLSVIVVLISIKSIRNIDAMDKYLEVYRSFRSSPISGETDNLVAFGVRTKDEVLFNLLNNRFKLKDVSDRLKYKLWFEVAYTFVFSILFFVSLNEATRGELTRYTVMMSGILSAQLLVVSVWQITRFNDEIVLLEGENEIVTQLKVDMWGMKPSSVMLASFSFSLLTNLLISSFYNISEFCVVY